MLRISDLLFLLLLSVCSQAQDSIAIFKVVKSKTTYTISPESNVLKTGIDNSICIIAEGEGKIAKVELKGGAITKKGDCYIARVVFGEINEAILSVYEQLLDGSSKLIETKKYKIVVGIKDIMPMQQREEFNRTKEEK